MKQGSNDVSHSWKQCFFIYIPLHRNTTLFSRVWATEKITSGEPRHKSFLESPQVKIRFMLSRHLRRYIITVHGKKLITWTLLMASTSKPRSWSGNVADLLPTYPDTTWLWTERTRSSDILKLSQMFRPVVTWCEYKINCCKTFYHFLVHLWYLQMYFSILETV
jgi:hypothetical protein